MLFTWWETHILGTWLRFWPPAQYQMTWSECWNPLYFQFGICLGLRHGILVEWILWLEIEELSRPQIPAKFKNIFDFGQDRSGVPSHASQTLYHWAMKAWYFKAWNILKISSGATQPGQPGHWAAQKNRSTSTVCLQAKKRGKSIDLIFFVLFRQF